MGDAQADPIRREIHALVDCIPSSDLPTARKIVRSLVDPVELAILNASPDDEPESVEAKLVHDADILEQLGVVGLLRVVVKVGRDTRYPTFTSVVPGLRRAAAELAGKTCLESARELAAGRANVLNGLLRALEDEAGEHLH